MASRFRRHQHAMKTVSFFFSFLFFSFSCIYFFAFLLSFQFQLCKAWTCSASLYMSYVGRLCSDFSWTFVFLFFFSSLRLWFFFAVLWILSGTIHCTSTTWVIQLFCLPLNFYYHNVVNKGLHHLIVHFAINWRLILVLLLWRPQRPLLSDADISGRRGA